jgi:hypothetical protein
MSQKSAIAFRIKARQKVTALTGIVITRKPPTVRMLKENKFDKFTVPAGDDRTRKGQNNYAYHQL